MPKRDKEPKLTRRQRINQEGDQPSSRASLQPQVASGYGSTSHSSGRLGGVDPQQPSTSTGIQHRRQVTERRVRSTIEVTPPSSSTSSQPTAYPTGSSVSLIY